MCSAVILGFGIAAFAWGLTLTVYRWIASESAWPMGVWQAERPVLPRLIGLGAMAAGLVSGAALGGSAFLTVVLLGLVAAVLWLRLLKVGAQSALLLAPAAAALTLLCGLLGAG